METILRYAKDDELKHVRQKADAVAVANAELRKVQDARGRVARELNSALSYLAYDYRAAAQRAMGSDVVEVPVAKPKYTREELQAQMRGLEGLEKEAEARVADAKGAFRAAVVVLLRDCGNRAAEDYLEAAKTLGWCYAQIVAANQLTQSGYHTMLGDADWHRIRVPGSSNLLSLRRNTHMEDGGEVLMTGFSLQPAVNKVPAALREEGVKAFGAWPM